MKTQSFNGDVFVRGKQAEEILIDILDNLATRALRSAAAFRNVLLGGGFIAVNPLLEVASDARPFFERYIHALQVAVWEGRMLDFGHIPNAVIKAESTRARQAFEAGELLQPYDEAGWLGVTSWEGGYNGYFVQPQPDNGVLVLEMYGVRTPDGPDLVLLYDAVVIRPKPGNTTLLPFPMATHLPAQHTMQSDQMRASNSLDPLATMLRFLADASVPVTQFTPDAKLNRARAKSGKLPLPSHSVVHTGDYVSQIAARASGRTQGDGTGRHASPTAHWRRSHLRHLPGDRVVKVRSSKVNWRSGEEMHRLFSKVTTAKPEEGLTS